MKTRINLLPLNLVEKIRRLLWVTIRATQRFVSHIDPLLNFLGRHSFAHLDFVVALEVESLIAVILLPCIQLCSSLALPYRMGLPLFHL